MGVVDSRYRDTSVRQLGEVQADRQALEGETSSPTRLIKASFQEQMQDWNITRGVIKDYGKWEYEQENDDSDRRLSEEEFIASPHFRQGMKFKEGMTVGDAYASARMHDIRAYRQAVINEYKGDNATLLQLGGSLAAMPFSPENFMPIAPLSRTMNAMKLAARMSKGGMKMSLAAAAAGALDNGVMIAGTQPYLAQALRDEGSEVAWEQYAMEMAAGMTFGATLGAGAGFLQSRGLKPEAAGVKAFTEAATKFEEMGNFDHVDVSKIPELRESVDTVREHVRDAMERQSVKVKERAEVLRRKSRTAYDKSLETLRAAEFETKRAGKSAAAGAKKKVSAANRFIREAAQDRAAPLLDGLSKSTASNLRTASEIVTGTLQRVKENAENAFKARMEANVRAEAEDLLPPDTRFLDDLFESAENLQSLSREFEADMIIPGTTEEVENALVKSVIEIEKFEDRLSELAELDEYAGDFAEELHGELVGYFDAVRTESEQRGLYFSRGDDSLVSQAKQVPVTDANRAWAEEYLKGFRRKYKNMVLALNTKKNELQIVPRSEIRSNKAKYEPLGMNDAEALAGFIEQGLIAPNQEFSLWNHYNANFKKYKSVYGEMPEGSRDVYWTQTPEHFRQVEVPRRNIEPSETLVSMFPDREPDWDATPTLQEKSSFVELLLQDPELRSMKFNELPHNKTSDVRKQLIAEGITPEKWDALRRQDVNTSSDDLLDIGHRTTEDVVYSELGLDGRYSEADLKALSKEMDMKLDDLAELREELRSWDSNELLSHLDERYDYVDVRMAELQERIKETRNLTGKELKEAQAEIREIESDIHMSGREAEAVEEILYKRGLQEDSRVAQEMAPDLGRGARIMEMARAQQMSQADPFATPKLKPAGMDEIEMQKRVSAHAGDADLNADVQKMMDTDLQKYDSFEELNTDPDLSARVQENNMKVSMSEDVVDTMLSKCGE